MIDYSSFLVIKCQQQSSFDIGTKESPIKLNFTSLQVFAKEAMTFGLEIFQENIFVHAWI